jgi:hypothetical protein
MLARDTGLYEHTSRNPAAVEGRVGWPVRMDARWELCCGPQ